MKSRFVSFLGLGLLAGLAAVTLAAAPAAAFHKDHGYYRRDYQGHYQGHPHPHFGPAYYAPAYPVAFPAPYPVAYPAAYPASHPWAYPAAYVPPPPVIAAPAAPIVAPPVAVPPVAAGPVLPAPAAPLPAQLPPTAAAGPVAPGIEGTPGCLVVREYTTEIEIGGETAEGYGYACLQADGSWQRGAPAPIR